jgi:hypothetical protein
LWIFAMLLGVVVVVVLMVVLLATIGNLQGR